MGLPCRVEFTLTVEDFSAAIGLLLSPGPVMKRLRPVLMRFVWLLLAASGGLIAYAGWLLRRGLGPAMDRQMLAYCAIIGIWAALLYLTARISRDPDAALRWLRELMTRRMLARIVPGPRTLVLTEQGFELQSQGELHVRTWSVVRRARRDEERMLLAARDIWVIIPLARLSPELRAQVVKETGERVRVEVEGQETGVAA